MKANGNILFWKCDVWALSRGWTYFSKECLSQEKLSLLNLFQDYREHISPDASCPSEFFLPVPRLSDLSPPPAEPPRAESICSSTAICRGQRYHTATAAIRHLHRVTAYRETRARFLVLFYYYYFYYTNISPLLPLEYATEQSNPSSLAPFCLAQKRVDPTAKTHPRCKSLEQPAALGACLLTEGRRKKQHPPICRCDPQSSQPSCASTCLQLSHLPPVQLDKLLAPQVHPPTPPITNQCFQLAQLIWAMSRSNRTSMFLWVFTLGAQRQPRAVLADLLGQHSPNHIQGLFLAWKRVGTTLGSRHQQGICIQVSSRANGNCTAPGMTSVQRSLAADAQISWFASL